MAARTLLDELELPQAQCVDVEDEHALVPHAVPALEGDWLQRQHRRAARVSITGVLTGEQTDEGGEALRTRLGELREKFRAAAPVDFVADITTATRVSKVLIEKLEVREVAGRAARFEYAFALREWIDPPRPEIENPPPRPGPPIDPARETGTLVVEVTVEGQPDYDMSRVVVTAQGRGADGTVSTTTLTDRAENVWTEDEVAPGEYTVRAVVADEGLEGSAPASIGAGQTTRVQITLAPRRATALAFIVHFRFDNAFVEPCMRAVLRRAVDFGNSAAHASERLLVVGHTDRTGTDQYNQSLSERRARAVFAFLTFGRDPDGAVREWTALRQPRPAGTIRTLADSWGTRELQWMLQDLGFYPGTIDGDAGPMTREAIRAYRCHKGLPPGTHVDDELWDALIRDYLGQDSFAWPENRLLPNCPGEPLKWLGCGEEDPVNNTQDAHRPNRRVELLFVTETALPCQAPEPDTFRLPPPDGAGTSWCVGGPPATSGHACFMTRPPAAAVPGKPAFALAEPATVDVAGRISREVRQADGSVVLERVGSRPFVVITSAGEFRRAEQRNGASRGEPIPDTTSNLAPPARGTFAYTGVPEGIYTVDVIPQPRSQPVLARIEEEADAQVEGGVICKRIHAGDSTLNVVIVAAPAVREIRLRAVAHVMTALNPSSPDRAVRTCTGFGGRVERQASALTDAQVRAAFAGANRIWQQGRVRFELVDIVREAYSFRTECEVDETEFAILLERCNYPRAVNVFFVGDLSGNGEAGFGLSPEGAVASGLAPEVSGCGLGDRFQHTILGPPISTDVDDTLREQVLAHELAHYLDIDHVTGADAADPNRLMQPGSSTGTNRRLVQAEVDRARASQGAADDCTPLTLRVTGAARIGGTLSHRFVFVRDPASPPQVTVDAEIPDAMVDPARGALVIGGPNTTPSGPRQVTVATDQPRTVEVTATYTPVGGTPVVRRVFVHVVDFELAVDGAVRVGTSTVFVAIQNATQPVTVRAVLSSTPFCVPDNLVGWTGGTRVDDPLRVTVPRANTGTFPVAGTVAGITRSVTIAVSTLTLRVEGAIEVNATTFATARSVGTHTVVAVLTPAVAPPPPVTWAGATPTADPLRATFTRTPAGSRTVSATIGGTTVSVTILVMEVVSYTQTAPAGHRLDLLSNPGEPILRTCVGRPSDLTVDIDPDAGPAFYTTNPAAVVDLAPTSRVGDGAVTVTPRALPAGTDRAVGRDTRLSTRVSRADGPELPLRGGPDTPARVRIRVFDEITVALFLHVVRNDNGTHPAGVTIDNIVAGLNGALDLANTLYAQACIRFRMRQRAGTAPKTTGYTTADLQIDFIDETDFLDISVTVNPTTLQITNNESIQMFSHGGTNRNTANPTFINLYVIERFVGSPGLGGIGGVAEGNNVTIERGPLTANNLFAHEVGHALNLPDLDTTGTTNLNQRLMTSAGNRGELLASGGTPGDEIATARRRALTFTGL